MDFKLNDEQQLLQTMFREFVEKSAKEKSIGNLKKTEER